MLARGLLPEGNHLLKQSAEKESCLIGFRRNELQDEKNRSAEAGGGGGSITERVLQGNENR